MPHTYPSCAKLFIISDLHLQSDHHDLTHQLIDWVQQHRTKATAIYILGDLFDYWVGDSCSQRYSKFLNVISRTSQYCPIYFMPGNRDFLLSKSLLRHYGVTKINDPTPIQFGDQRILLTHGDRLCSNDTSYQWLRFLLQNPVTLSLAACMPYSVCQMIARKLRQISGQKTASKRAQIMLADDATTRSFARMHQSSIVIHGHVHRLEVKTIPYKPDIHVHVLDSWENQINHCQIDHHGVKLVT